MEKSANHTSDIQLNDFSARLDQSSEITMKSVWIPNSSPSNCERFSGLISLGRRVHIAVFTGLFIGSTLLASFLTYYVFMNISKNKEAESWDNLCTSKECVESAASILQRLDLSATPCDDFYKFACGQFVNTKSIPDDHYVFGTLQQMEEYSLVWMRKFLEENITDSDGDATAKMKLFYTSCMQDKFVNNETRTVRTLIEYLEDYGGSWLLLESVIGLNLQDQANESVSLESKFISAYMHQSPSIFRISLLNNHNRNASKNDLYISAGQTVMQDEYLANVNNSRKYDEYRQHYRDYMLKVITRVGNIMTGEEKVTISSAIKERLDHIIKFESELAKLVTSEMMEVQDPKSFQEVQWMNTTELDETFPHLNWSLILNRLGTLAGTKIERVCIENREYLANLSKLFEVQSRRTVSDYISWSILARFIDYLGSQFRRYSSEFRRKVPSIDNQRVFFSRWKECVFYSTHAFQVPASSIYWRHRKDYVIYASNKVRRMLSLIKESIYKIIDNQNWLAQDVRETLKTRIKESELKVGFPDYVHQDQIINRRFEDLEITLDGVFISNWLNVIRHQQTLELLKLNEIFDMKGDWLLPVTEANAFYDSSLKIIVMPSGILHRPIIHGERPGYLEFSTLGHVLGHEIGHAIEKEQYDFNSRDSLNSSQTWSNDTRAEYERRASCFAEQFSSFKLQGIDEFVNGNLTLSENICDYVGLQQAITAWNDFPEKTYQKLPGLSNYTDDQLFFIYYGQLFCEVSTEEGVRRTWARDVHSPGEFRVNGILMNTPQFARAFNCPLESPMNPREKCDLFLYDVQ